MRRSVSLLTLGVVAVLSCGAGSASAAGPRPTRRSGRADESPAVGEKAPDFELVSLGWLLMSDRQKAKADAAAKKRSVTEGEDAKAGHVRLSSFRGKRPVIFVLTSYT